ncbi:cxxc_20_cxxc protein [Lentibacillus persicus]|uniref:Cxxc_20_cxxc protein n=1 Tax=Lentibacillus persicus TaxID=640948 RepID=A0A1I1SBP8_9BACI|nr:TIGR04104 family putative zinc finger protein [Lentibacillus persicus]SFD41263.1 cxxc_20_cxxc protein [Lentibacillus persicus]
MPSCEKCGHTWSWKQTLKKSFTLDPAMKCPNCGEKQYQTRKSRKKSSFLTFIIISPLLLNFLFDIPGVILLSLFPVLFLAVMAIHPFLIKLSSKEEYINFLSK